MVHLKRQQWQWDPNYSVADLFIIMNLLDLIQTSCGSHLGITGFNTSSFILLQLLLTLLASIDIDGIL